jgi:MFS transporter, PHS family, inorganic phosphate transporter
VAASGFFTDSYNLFATNVILPSLVFVYWTEDTSGDHETAINCITLAGSLLGQLIFGYLADRFGRRKLYGLELIVVIFGTLGMVQSSAGYNQQSMSILGWIMFWRFFVGLGIGAEYPLSAVITTESVFHSSPVPLIPA